MRRFAGGRLVVATHNPGKLVEIADLLGPYGADPVSAASLGLPEPEETEATYTGNARLKAVAAATASGLPALADDSGLGVEALGGAPGVLSARLAEGPGGRDFRRAMGLVWERVSASGAAEPYGAAFYCALSMAWPDGTDVTVLGQVRGTLVWPPRGSFGFGYDPMFVPQGHVLSFGEMAPAAKHAISHRADAFAQLVAACFGGAQ